jgi:hypothetical protein
MPDAKMFAQIEAENPLVRGFWVTPARNDIIPMPCGTQMTLPDAPDELDAYRFSVPATEIDPVTNTERQAIWYITFLWKMLYPGAQWQNPGLILMHIFCNETSKGKNTAVWSTQASFAQWQLISQTTGDPSVQGAIQPITPPLPHLVTDVGDARYWTYAPQEFVRGIPLPGPSVIEVGMFNANPAYPNPNYPADPNKNDPARSPDASAFLSFFVSKERPW